MFNASMFAIIYIEQLSNTAKVKKSRFFFVQLSHVIWSTQPPIIRFFLSNLNSLHFVHWKISENGYVYCD